MHEIKCYFATNFDLLSGIDAPVVGYLAFRISIESKRLLLWGNIICPDDQCRD